MSSGSATAWLQAGGGGLLIVLLALPPSRAWLEADLIGHVLVQIPLLILSGWLIGEACAHRFRDMGHWNKGGVAGLTLVIFTALFWMLPRSIDSAVQQTTYEVIKFMSLPCAGAALGTSFPRAHTLLRGALKANLISMIGVLAWLYTAAPVRLCISYFKSDQEMLGLAMALLAGALAIGWGVGLLFGATRPSIADEGCSSPANSPTPSKMRYAVDTLKLYGWTAGVIRLKMPMADKGQLEHNTSRVQL
jgi:hypothetical protein